MLQVASRSLGVSVDKFRMMHTSTDKVPNTSATAASSGSDLNGQAVKNACDILKERLAPIAAQLLNLDGPEEMVFKDDHVYCRTAPYERVAFKTVVTAAYDARVSLSATGFYRTPQHPLEPRNLQRSPLLLLRLRCRRQRSRGRWLYRLLQTAPGGYRPRCGLIPQPPPGGPGPGGRGLCAGHGLADHGRTGVG